MNRHELLHFENRLFKAFSTVIPCAGHAIYFPRDNGPDHPVWLASERKLLVPLRADGTLLGVLMCRNVLHPERMAGLLPHVENLAALCLDNVGLYREGRLDPQTGLATRAVLMEHLNAKTRTLRAMLERAERIGNLSESMDESGFGISVVQFAGIPDLSRTYGYAFMERMLTAQAEALRPLPSEQTVIARTGEYEFAFVTCGGHAETLKATIAAVHRLDGVSLAAPHTGRPVRLLPHAGFALYPQDLDGGHGDDLAEPAAALLRKAARAARTARTMPEDERVTAFGAILRKGGRIIRILPVSTVEISLGRNDNVRNGMHFAIWRNVKGGGASPVYKGEIVVTDVADATAVAEILRLGDERLPVATGDGLRLLSDAESADTVSRASGTEASGVLRHTDFLARLPSLRESLVAFSLVMLRVPGSPFDEASLAAALRISRTHGNPVGLIGRYAANTLIFFHPTGDVPSLTETYAAICKDLAALPDADASQCGAGIAVWPFLHYHPGDMTECSRKALDYAMLLPAPHVGVFGSLAINISADRRHCRGDLFGAVEEYRLALLADAGNALAWNSLGVCMEAMGHDKEARAHFEKAAQASPGDPSIVYNLGGACLRLGDTANARKAFLRCLELDGNHLYANIRLAQMDEEEGRSDRAVERYLRLTETSPTSAAPYRCLARLAMRNGHTEEAREHLHKALLRDARDADAMTMMARLYLDGGEDAELAEYLVRKSLSIRPERKASWAVLARALEIRGLARESKEAWLHAEAL